VACLKQAFLNSFFSSELVGETTLPESSQTLITTIAKSIKELRKQKERKETEST